MNNLRVSAGLGINEKLILKMDKTLEEPLPSRNQRFLPLCLPVSCRYSAPIPEFSLGMQISKSIMWHESVCRCVCAFRGKRRVSNRTYQMFEPAFDVRGIPATQHISPIVNTVATQNVIS